MGETCNTNSAHALSSTSSSGSGAGGWERARERYFLFFFSFFLVGILRAVSGSGNCVGFAVAVGFFSLAWRCLTSRFRGTEQHKEPCRGLRNEDEGVNEGNFAATPFRMCFFNSLQIWA